MQALLAERNGVLQIQIHRFVELSKRYKIDQLRFHFCSNGCSLKGIMCDTAEKPKYDKNSYMDISLLRRHIGLNF